MKRAKCVSEEAQVYVHFFQGLQCWELDIVPNLQSIACSKIFPQKNTRKQGCNTETHLAHRAVVLILLMFT